MLVEDRAALVEAEARERELRSECEKRGLPVDVAGLIRHCEGNAALTVAFDKIAAENRVAVLVEALKEAEQALELLARKGWGGDVGEPEEIASDALTRLAALAGVVEAEPDGEDR